MDERPRPKFLPIRDPWWRQSVAVRVGIPFLGALLAVTLAWLISRA
jgi:hypothetical protein